MDKFKDEYRGILFMHSRDKTIKEISISVFSYKMRSLEKFTNGFEYLFLSLFIISRKIR